MDYFQLLMDQAIALELKIAKLYRLFSRHNDEDDHFWQQLADEEEYHVKLIELGKDMARLGKTPVGLVPESVEELYEENKHVENAITSFSENPDRFYAFEIAYTIENSIGEAHLQNYLNADSPDDIRDIFRKLNIADKDHATRIKEYWDKLLYKD